jgi:uncharacterized protein (DUF1697 family)
VAIFVCLLRAIGPETHALMSMAALRGRCESAGLDDVATHGSTGNVICRSDKEHSGGAGSGARDCRRLRNQERGLRPHAAAMLAVVRANPFPDAARRRPAEVGVCSFHKTPRWPEAVKAFNEPQRLATVGAHLIVDCPAGISGSRLDMERLVGARMTMRNWRVFAALAEKAAARARG